MIKSEHLKDGKVKDEHRSKYSVRELDDLRIDGLTEKQLLAEILKELKKKRNA